MWRLVLCPLSYVGGIESLKMREYLVADDLESLREKFLFIRSFFCGASMTLMLAHEKRLVMNLWSVRAVHSFSFLE